MNEFDKEIIARLSSIEDVVHCCQPPRGPLKANPSR